MFVSGQCPGEVQGIGRIEVNDLEIELQGGNPLCNGQPDGMANLVISGGQDPFFIEWVDGSNMMTLENLIAGIYSVTVTDESGCSQIAEIELQNPDELDAEITPQGISTCTNPDAGSISLNVSGGTEPYTYIWNTGEETKDLSGLETGLYLSLIHI